MRIFYTWGLSRDPDFSRAALARGIRLVALVVNPVSVLLSWFALRGLRRRTPVRRRHVLFAGVISKFLRTEEPTVMVSALHPANVAASYAIERTRLPCPHVVTVHSNVTMSYSGPKLLEAEARYPKADAVVGVAEGLSRNIQHVLGVRSDRVRTIQNTIPYERVRRLSEARVEHFWFGPDEPPVILNVGREAQAKDYGNLIDGFGLASRTVRARLVILGRFSASFRVEMRRRADGWGVGDRIEFLDFDENPFKFVRRAALFVLTSLWEGFPLVLLEALACGTPVVSTDAPYGPREILDGGALGKLVPPGEPEPLAAAIVEALNGDHPPSDVLQRRASEFSTERAVNAYLSLFEDLAGARQERGDG